MVHLMRTAMSRDLGGMGRPDLYHHSHIGTKQLIERYVDSATDVIESLISESAVSFTNNVSYSELLDGLLLARQSFGRSALLLSGGATFGMMHIGVVKTLFTADLLPRIISGASAGSIVGAVICTRTDEEVPALIEEFPYGDLDVFDEKGYETDVFAHVGRLLTEGTWSDIKNLTRVMRELLGDLTFQEAYNRTRRILNITVSSQAIYELPRLLNYVTAPNVIIWSAVAASCSVPFIFTSASLLVKDPLTGTHVAWNATPRRWIDGSVDNDLPMTRLAEMFNVNHFIVSQVNPHVVPFLAKEENIKPYIHSDSVAHGQEQPDRAGDWMATTAGVAIEEILHRLQLMIELNIAPNLATKLQSIISQGYSGDINILPEIAMQDIPRMLLNPTSDFMLRSCLSGERATWPKISRIRDRCAIELALDRAVISLRARVVFSSSQVDLRRMATGPFSNQIEPEDATSRANEATQTEEQDEESNGDRRPMERRGSGSSIQMVARQRKMTRERDGMENDVEGEVQPEAAKNTTGPSGRRGTPRLQRASRSHYDERTGLGLMMSPMELNNAPAEAVSLSPPDPLPMRILDSNYAQETDDYKDWLSLPPRRAGQACDDGAQTEPVSPAVRTHPPDAPLSDGATSTNSEMSVSDPDPYSDS